MTNKFVRDQRIKDLEEMEDNRKTRVESKVRQQQNQSPSPSARQKAATLAAPGVSWSSVVKASIPASSPSSTEVPATSSVPAERPKTPQRAGRAEYVLSLQRALAPAQQVLPFGDSPVLLVVCGNCVV